MVETLYRMAGVLSSLSGVGQTPAAPTTQPSEALPESLPSWTIGLLTIGVILTLIWLARRILSPDKFTLTRTPGRPNRLNPAHVLLVYFVLHAPSLILAVIFLSTGGEASGRPPTEPTLIAQLAGQVLAVAAALLVARWCFTGRIRRGLGLCGRHWLYDTLRGGVGFVALLPWCLGLAMASAWVLRQINPDLVRLHTMLGILPELNVGWQAVVIVSAVILAPLVEELIFRGLMQSMLRRVIGPWGAILASTGIFAFLHFGQGAQAIPALLLLSVVLGYNYERTGRLVAPIAIHMLFNLVMILIFLTA